MLIRSSVIRIGHCSPPSQSITSLPSSITIVFWERQVAATRQLPTSNVCYHNNRAACPSSHSHPLSLLHIDLHSGHHDHHSAHYAPVHLPPTPSGIQIPPPMFLLLHNTFRPFAPAKENPPNSPTTPEIPASARVPSMELASSRPPTEVHPSGCHRYRAAITLLERSDRTAARK